MFAARGKGQGEDHPKRAKEVYIFLLTAVFTGLLMLYLWNMYSLHSRKSSPISEVSSPRTCLLGPTKHSELFHFEATDMGRGTLSLNTNTPPPTNQTFNQKRVRNHQLERL